MIGKVESKTIDILRFPCAYLVVVIHTFNSIWGGYNGSITGAFDCVRVLCSQGIARLAVPIFFLTSGYLFFSGMEKWSWGVWGTKIKKRIHSLLVPYLIWNFILLLLYAVYYIVKGNIGGFFSFLDDNGNLLFLWNCGRNGYSPRINILGWEMWDGAFPLNFPLWFIRDLIVLTILAPICYYI